MLRPFSQTKMIKKIWFITFLVIILPLACGVTVYAEGRVQPVNKENFKKIIYLVSHGWHAGIVIKRADIPAILWSESQVFFNAEYLEVGWGDQDYYMTPDPHLGIALKAILWPTSSVLHIVGFNQVVTAYFSISEIIEIRLSDNNFKRLIQYIGASHERIKQGSSKPIAEGLYGNSQFYLSSETYHLFRTCNDWTAKALHTGGCPINSAVSTSAEELMYKAKTCGVVIQKPVNPL